MGEGWEGRGGGGRGGEGIGGEGEGNVRRAEETNNGGRKTIKEVKDGQVTEDKCHGLSEINREVLK